MSDVVISVEKLSKKYRLGEIGATSLREAAERSWLSLKRRFSLAERAEAAEGNISHKVAKSPSKAGADSRRLSSPEDAQNLSKRASESSGQSSGADPAKGGHARCAGPSAPALSGPSCSWALERGGAGVRNSDSSDLWALKDVSFEVKRGEVLGIIGRNGAGKSTLLKILSRITEPTSGRAILRGRVGSLLEVGTGFHPELSGRDNIFLSGAILGMKKREIASKFDEIVAFAEVEKFIDTPVKRYSSGMYVRLAFAVAAHLDPEILLVDEVLAVGDAAFQKKCLGKMGEVSHQGRTIIFVSHNMTAVKSLCGRAIWLDYGRVRETGETSYIIDDYLQSNVLSVTDRKWPDDQSAPGNEKVRVLSAKIIKPDDVGDGPIRVNTPFKLEFVIRNFTDQAIININAHFRTAEGIAAFSVCSDSKPRHKGLIRAILSVPPNMLNDGVYIINLQIVQNTGSLYEEPDMLTLEIHDIARTGHWHGKWPGVLRPIFEWQTENV